MFYLLRKKIEAISNQLFGKKNEEDDILNVAMNLSLEWGKNWLRPVDERLKAIFPNISDNEAKRIDTFIREAREDIFKIVEQHYKKELSEIEVKLKIKEKYPFLHDENYKWLISQGMYYAWKDNG